MLEKMKNMTEQDFIEYDVVSDCVNPVTGEKLFNGAETGLQRFTKFRNTEFDYDADSSIESVSIAKAVYPFAQDCRIETQESPYNADGLLYELRGSGMLYRSDTMNSAATTLRQYRLVFGADAELPAIADDFLKLYHTPGNFNLLPYMPGFSLNGPRGIGASCDYFDLFLLAVYHYCYGEGGDAGWTPERIFGDPAKAAYYTKWFDETFSDGKGSKWENYIAQNFLEDYLDEGGRPKELWNGHFKGNVYPKAEEEFLALWTNASGLIRKRSGRIYKALH